MIRIILLVLLCALIYCYYNNTKENFNRNHGKWGINCSKKSFGQCMDCFNCGFCMTGSNTGYCTKGTVFGPDHLENNCRKWIHNDEWITNMHIKNKYNSL